MTMQSSRLQRIKGKLDRGIYSARQRGEYKALLGLGDAAQTLFVENRGREWVWARIQGHGAPQRALCTRVTPLHGLPVKLEKNGDGDWEVTEIDSRHGSAFTEGRGLPSTPQHNWTHGEFGSDPVRIAASQIAPFLTRPTEPEASLSVYLEPATYIDMDGNQRAWLGDALDLTSYVPTSTQQQRIVITGINRDTGVKQVIAASPAIITQATTTYMPFTGEDAAAVALDEDFEPSFAVRLYKDQTTIQQHDIFWDMRRWLGAPNHSSDGLKAVQTDDETVANTDTETSLIGTVAGTVTIPANTLEAGTVIRITGGGQFDTVDGTPTLNIRLKLGGTTILDSGGMDISSGAVTTGGWHLDVLLTCRTGGDMVGNGLLQFGTLQETLRTASPVTINPAVDLAFDLTVEWSDADASNSITTQTLLLELKAIG